MRPRGNDVRRQLALSRAREATLSDRVVELEARVKELEGLNAALKDALIKSVEGAGARPVPSQPVSLATADDVRANLCVPFGGQSPVPDDDASHTHVRTLARRQ